MVAYEELEIRRLRVRAGIVLAGQEGTGGRYGYGNRSGAPRDEAIAAPSGESSVTGLGAAPQPEQAAAPARTTERQAG